MKATEAEGHGLYWNDDGYDERTAARLDLEKKLTPCPTCGEVMFHASVPYWYVQCCGKSTLGFDWPEDAADQWDNDTVTQECKREVDNA